MLFRSVIALIFAIYISRTLAAPQPKRSLMYWMVGGPPGGKPEPDAVWKERIANVSKHRQNVTAISPCIHGITPSGTFGNQGQGVYSEIAPYLPQFQAMGLDVVPIIYNIGGLGGMQRLLSKSNSHAFIKAAVDKAVEMDYVGYNMDNELRGNMNPKSWMYLKPYAEPWMDFLNEFADALHAKNKTLSVDIEGCCGWVDAQHPKAPAGHCADGFADFEFVATTCAMYRQSRLDRVIGMGTYSDSISNAGSPYGPETLKTMATAASKAIGITKYGYGFKGGWNSYGRFSETAKETIRYLRDTIGVQHAFHWANEPLSQADWDAWGFFLHDGLDASEHVVV